ncbi:hypothetical protein ACI2OX_04355 [Bacillus sp. N9]
MMELGAASSPVWSVSATSKHPELATELIKELTSVETAKAYIDRTGALTAINGVEPEDEFIKRIYDLVREAKTLQMPYDQTLPAELAELHKNTTQAIFGLSMTPEEAAKKWRKQRRKFWLNNEEGRYLPPRKQRRNLYARSEYIES